MNNKSFFGGAIYIDLREYTTIVEKKVLENIAMIIYDYQDLVAVEINKIFKKETISAIEYIGDGIMIILNNYDFSIEKDSQAHDSLCNKIYEASKALKTSLSTFLKNQKEQYTGLEKLDFGIGISCSTVFQKYHEKDNRRIFFGTCLNRAAKIGDSVSSKFNHIAIDKKCFDKYLSKNLEKDKLKLRRAPLSHYVLS